MPGYLLPSPLGLQPWFATTTFITHNLSYDKLFFMTLCPCPGIPLSLSYHDFTLSLPRIFTLEDGRGFSIRSGLSPLPFVFGLRNIPRRTGLSLESLTYFRLLDLPSLEPLTFVFGRQPRLWLLRPSQMA